MNPEYDYTLYHHQLEGGRRWTFDFLYYIGWPIRDLIAQLVCRVKGHDWQDNSYGGPETGCIDMDCRRCGYGFHHTLY